MIQWDTHRPILRARSSPYDTPGQDFRVLSGGLGSGPSSGIQGALLRGLSGGLGSGSSCERHRAILIVRSPP